MTDGKQNFEIVIDRDAGTYSAHDRLTGHEQAARPLPDEPMPWRFEVGQSPLEAGELAVSMAGTEPAFDPTHATACSVIAVEAWITDKVFETHDDTIYVVRVVNTSTHYVAEDICVDLHVVPPCVGGEPPEVRKAVEALRSDNHDLIEIQPTHQCIKCLAPRHYVDLRFVAISRGPQPGVFPVRACVTYDLVYWTRARAQTHARLELEVHDECKPRRDPCRPPRRVPPDPGDYCPAPQPECPEALLWPCGADESEPADSAEGAPEPTTTASEAPAEIDAPEEPRQDDEERVDERLGDAAPSEADETKGSEIMPKENKQQDQYHDHHEHCDHEHYHQSQPKKPKPTDDDSEKDDKVSNKEKEKKGCAPACSNADELLPITDDCRLPEGGILEFSYTFRKGFIGSAGKGGRCVYGKSAHNGKPECRMESIDDTVLVLDVTNHSRYHLKHVRIQGVRIFQNHEEVTQTLPSGHPIAQIVPTAVYIGTLPRGDSKWVALSFITRGVAAGSYAVKFCVDYDIEACTVSAGINVDISCD